MSEQPEKGESKFKKWISSPGGKKQAIVIIIIVIILAGAGYSAYSLTRTDKPGTNSIVDTVKNALPKLDETKSTTIASKLDGQQYDPSIANRAPLAVVVENHPDARPQSGLDKASIVYEAISEGGITRFLAVFGPQDAETVGPVRSARTYFLDWVEGMGAFFAHAGGNRDALARIQKETVNDLDQFANSSAYWRDDSRNVASEHTLYGSTKKLYELAKSKGWSLDSKITSYTYKDDAKTEQRPTSQTVDVKFSSAQYNVKYTYNPAENNYLRYMGGVAHKDAQTDQQIKVKNIAAIEVTRWYSPAGADEPGYAMQTTGTGKATLFVDGKQIDATWKKEKTTSQIEFTDSAGKAVELNRGNLWIEVMPPETGVSLTVS
jgi:hypothetical protein